MSTTYVDEQGQPCTRTQARDAVSALMNAHDYGRALTIAIAIRDVDAANFNEGDYMESAMRNQENRWRVESIARKKFSAERKQMALNDPRRGRWVVQDGAVIIRYGREYDAKRATDTNPQAHYYEDTNWQVWPVMP
jgi:hypothetical protein